MASIATLYILEYHQNRHKIHPHLTLGPPVGSPVGTTGPGSVPYQFYNIYNHPNGSQIQQYATPNHLPPPPPPPPHGQNAFDFATPGHATVPYLNLAPPVVDSKGHSNNNVISSISSQEKIPNSNRGELILFFHE